MSKKAAPQLAKTPVLLRVDPVLLNEVEAYLQRCREMGMAGSRASVFVEAARRGIGQLRAEIDRKR